MVFADGLAKTLVM